MVMMMKFKVFHSDRQFYYIQPCLPMSMLQLHMDLCIMDLCWTCKGDQNTVLVWLH